ncbi:hypothetical protein ABT224_33575 [Streptomyces sp. NPDC001584]|uniref:hypothetical protein n=1 Tax=Streptomyces sp. NPDC001584 TaxID=3154521 RepID=UPI00331E3921
MGWLLDSDTKRAHIGAALGYIGEAEAAPTFRMGRFLVERSWTGGQWEGPVEGRPEQAPDYLRPVCSCGWTSQVLTEVERYPGLVGTEPVERLVYEDKARAHWLAHAVAATSAARPKPVAENWSALESWLWSLPQRQPLATLQLAREMREAIDRAVESAVAIGRALDISWEDLAAEAGTTRQQLWRKYRGVRIPPPGSDSLDSPRLPGYQHEPGQLDYTVTDVPLHGSSGPSPTPTAWSDQ